MENGFNPFLGSAEAHTKVSRKIESGAENGHFENQPKTSTGGTKMNVITSPDLMRVFTELASSVSDKDVLIVDLERKDDRGARTRIIGLDDVLEHAPSGRPIIMLGWLSRTNALYADDPRWHAALGYPNVTFCRLPPTKEEIFAAYQEAIAGKRAPDPLAIALLKVKIFKNDLGALHHDMHYAMKVQGERMERWEQRARQLLGDLPHDELIRITKQSREGRSASNELAGQQFPDVCLDVEGTLFNGEIFRPEVLASAEDLAQGGPITIWSGGDLQQSRRLIRSVRLPYKLVSKETMRGATVAAVFDDLHEEEFQKLYGVGYDKFIRVE